MLTTEAQRTQKYKKVVTARRLYRRGSLFGLSADYADGRRLKNPSQ